MEAKVVMLELLQRLIPYSFHDSIINFFNPGLFIYIQNTNVLCTKYLVVEINFNKMRRTITFV